MTVPSEVNRSGPYNGNGVTTVFSYNFRILSNQHLLVIKTDADGNETTLTLTTNYTVSGVGNAGGGSIALLVAPAGGTTITILRRMPFTQETDLENQGAYYAETVEDAFDAAAMRDQQLAEELQRAVKVPASSDYHDGDLTKELAAGILRLYQSADEIDVVAGIKSDVEAVAYISSDVQLLADNSAILVGTASAVRMDEKIFTGNGVATVWTLDRAPGIDENVLVWVGGAIQKTADYDVSGVSLTISPAVANGIEIRTLIMTLVTANYIEGLVDLAEAAASQAVGAVGINYHQFGVDDTGATSAVPAIRLAFAAAALTGQKVIPLKGTYLIDATIVMPADLYHSAPSGVKYINSVSSPANPMFINGAVGGTFLGRTANGGITWEGGTIDANDTVTECLAFGKANNIKVRGVRFENVKYSHFIEFNGIATGEITGCTFVNMTDPGGTRSYSEAINLDFAGNFDQFPFWNAASFDKTACLNIKVLGNTFVDCLVSVGGHGYSTFGDGTFATRSQFITIAGNTHLNNGVNTTGLQADAIHCDGFSGVEITGEVINNPKNNGIRLEDCIGWSVTGGYVSNAKGNAVFVVGDVADGASGAVSGLAARACLSVVRVQKANNISVTGCSGFSLRNGVWLEEADNCTVSGNTFEACTGRGVYVLGGSNRNSIAGNTIRNTAEANIELEGGSFNTVSGNSLSLPAASKNNIKVNGGATGVISGNTGNGATLLGCVYFTGNANHYSLQTNNFQGSLSGTAALIIDAGCDNILYANNRFDIGSSTITDNGENSVVGTNWFT